MIDYMESEADCVETIFQDYVVSRASNKIYLFFEGKDDCNYYFARLAPFIGSSPWKQYICKSKKNVLWISKKILDSTEKKQDEVLCYFVDNDFEKEKNTPDYIYVTPVYSIENFYVSDRAIENMITGIMGFSGEMDESDMLDYQDAVNFLICKRNIIIEEMLFSNAWYSLQHNKGKNKLDKPNLSALKEYSAIKNIQDKTILQGLTRNYVDVSDEELNEEIEFLKADPVKRLRGKYFEQTMPQHIMYLFQDSNKKSGRDIFRKKRKVTANINSENMILSLSNYAEVPDNLVRYLKQRFGFLNN